MRKIRIHDLRHTYASLLIEARKELHYIQEQLGRHSPSFTLTVYGHLLPRDRRGEVDCLDDEPASIRKPGASAEMNAKAEENETPQPSEIAGLSRAGDRGRTGDLMLGKHTL
jgi:hypothetical protein